MSSRPIPVPDRPRPAPAVVPQARPAPPMREGLPGGGLSLGLKLAFFFFGSMLIAAVGPFVPFVQNGPIGLAAYVGVVALAGLASAVYFWRNIVGTIHRVSQHAEMFSSGDLTRSVAVPRRIYPDETVELTIAINQ